jgi:flagellar biosynthesis component FlhA
MIYPYIILSFIACLFAWLCLTPFSKNICFSSSYVLCFVCLRPISCVLFVFILCLVCCFSSSCVFSFVFLRPVSCVLFFFVLCLHKTQDEDKQNTRHRTKKNKTQDTGRRQTKHKTQDEDKQNTRHRTKTNKAQDTWRRQRKHNKYWCTVLLKTKVHTKYCFFFVNLPQVHFWGFIPIQY